MHDNVCIPTTLVNTCLYSVYLENNLSVSDNFSIHRICLISHSEAICPVNFCILWSTVNYL